MSTQLLSPSRRTVGWLVVAAAGLLALLPLGAGAACTPGPVGAGDALVTFQRTGGFAGRSDSLRINREGSAVVTTRQGRRDLTLPREQVQQLRATLDAAQIDGLPSESWPARKGADLFTYELSYGGRTIRTMDGAVPPSLAEAIGVLSQILADNLP